MAATSGPAKAAHGTVSFELERFERADGRLELSGRWFGVRGMRFVRPTLTLGFGDGTASRLLADLEHKPWAPEAGEPWEAAFPCGEDIAVLDAELAVAPGIAIPLPAPGDELPETHLPAAVPSAPSTKGRRRRGPTARGSRTPPPSSDVRAELAALHEETQQLRQEPIRLQAELDRSEELRRSVEDELERLKLNADGAVARRNAAVDRFEDAATARDEAIRTRDEAVQAQNEAARARNEAVRERDGAVRARDEARREREAAAAERDRALARLREAVTERDAAVAARDAALAERVEATAERDAAVADRSRAVAERDRAVSERDEAVARCERAVAERDRARADLEKAASERDRVRSQHATSLAARSVTRAPAPAPAPVFLDHHDQLIKRAVAIAVLCIAGLALLIILGVF